MHLSLRQAILSHLVTRFVRWREMLGSIRHAVQS
jgi:hypothetical protein